MNQITTMMWRFLILLISHVVIVNFSSAQEVMWINHDTTYTGNLLSGYKVAHDDTGNVFVAVSNYHTGALIKYDPTGTKLWEKAFVSGLGVLGISGIQIDANNDLCIIGTGAIGYSSTDGYLFKLNSNGDTLWTKKYNFQNHDDGFNDIFIDNNSNIFVCGYAISNSAVPKMITRKYSSSGNLLWSMTYGHYIDYIYSTQRTRVDQNGNVYSCCSVFDSITNITNIELVKYNTSGVKQWASVINSGATNNDQVFDMNIDISGNIDLAGISNDDLSDPLYSIPLIMQVDSGGSVQWVKQIATPSSYAYNVVYSIQTDNSGIYIAGGVHKNATKRNGFIAKLNFAGDTLFTRYVDMPGHSDVYYEKMILRYNALYLVAFTLVSDTSPNYNYLTQKFHLDGSPTWTVEYNGAADMADWAYDLDVKNNGSAIVTGWSETSNLTSEVVTIAYGDTTFTGSALGNDGYLFNLYPNPAHDRITIAFENTLGEGAEVFIADLEGSIITHQRIDANMKMISIGNLPAGIYVCTLLSEYSLFQRKLVKQ